MTRFWGVVDSALFSEVSRSGRGEGAEEKRVTSLCPDSTVSDRCMIRPLSLPKVQVLSLLVA